MGIAMAATELILVTGASGNVGRHVVRRLLEEGRAVRVLTRDPARTAFPDGVEVVAGDLADPDSVRPALAGAGAVFLLWPTLAADHAADRTVPLLAEGGRRVVYLSARGVPDTGAGEAAEGIMGSHQMIERLLRESGADWTFVRPGGFAANVAPWFAELRDTGEVAMAHPGLSRALIHEADIAEVAVRALVEDGHGGAVYEITGPEALTQQEQARAVAEALGVPLRIRVLTEEEAVERMVAAGYPRDMSASVLAGQAAMLAAPDTPTPVFERVTGRKARDFRTWAADRVRALR
ncbi:NAD(P)H-binding protein [Streptomonospora sp. S1-112]|uniref:NAD(P)H-binding protein n=1 Tax=Streptomonospora mangrovi TaxID=2883123 RepID=A0A9X3SFP3_9ACTN|nr:NAD(P)H-binding protein [Streptomonospora mangrovi]MDA0563174.1 NAD(P)H-binding protein [Streptomonospora mangrovi]